MSGGLLLPIAIRRHAAARPAAIAVRAGGATVSYGALDRWADALAAGLAASGVVPGDRVALLASPSAGAIALLVGIARAGATALPLGARLAGPEIEAALAEGRPRLVIRDAFPAAAPSSGVPHGAAGSAGDPGVPALTIAEIESRGRDAPHRTITLDPRAPAVAVLTSGTTGRPKVALLSHAALVASAEAWTAALPAATGWLLCLGLAHVAGLGVAWRALGAGLPLVVLPAFEPAAVLAALGAGGGGLDAERGLAAPPPSHLSLVPVQLARLLEAAEAGGMAFPPPGLRALAIGGAPIPPELVARAVQAGWPIVPTYGLTEASSGVTALPALEAARAPWSAGRPLPSVAIRIVDAGPDGVGEIQVDTPAIFSGYLGLPDATAAAFTTDGWLRTGDLGRIDVEGRLEVADRRIDLLVSGGENVYPAEVEVVLAAHPGVLDAAVAGRPDPTWGAVPVAAIIVRAEASEPTDDELREWCRARLASYKVPVAFIRVRELPRSAGGKLRRAEVRALIGGGPQEAAAPTDGTLP